MQSLPRILRPLRRSISRRPSAAASAPLRALFATNAADGPNTKEKLEGELLHGPMSVSEETQRGRKVETQKEELPKFEGVIKSMDTAQNYNFQAETRKILDIVTNSIYTEKEVFLRELISNASDALESARHLQSQGKVPVERALQISIIADEKNKTLTITDTGVGMTKEQMIENLGTIARSGTHEFLETMKQKNEGSSDLSSSLIGQFGVGFYSSFMVADRVDVYSKSATDPSGKAYVWMSDGSGEFKITEGDHIPTGTSIVLHLKESESQYGSPKTVTQVVKKYSNFLNFPIVLNGKKVNTIQALWMMDKNRITDIQYTEFFKFVADTWDSPMYHLHFTADAPLSVQSLFFVGSTQTEKLGMGRMSPGVSLYSRKVLIESKSNKILPEWLRFVFGVVDSEDLPLSLSRENSQNSQLLARLQRVLTKRFLKFLEGEQKTSRKKYEDFYKEYQNFLREGLCTDQTYKDDLCSLMLYESSVGSNLISLNEYCELRKEGDIYFLTAANRVAAQTSPYFEAYKRKNIPVLFLYHPLDEYAFNSIATFKGRKLVSAEQNNVEVDSTPEQALDTTEVDSLVTWLKTTLSEKAKDVKVSNRLIDSPALIVDRNGSAMTRMMRMMQDTTQTPTSVPKEVLEINPSHEIIKQLNEKRKSNADIAKLIAEQIYDNCLIDAGLMWEPRSIIPRLNQIIESLLKSQ